MVPVKPNWRWQHDSEPCRVAGDALRISPLSLIGQLEATPRGVVMLGLQRPPGAEEHLVDQILVFYYNIILQ